MYRAPISLLVTLELRYSAHGFTHIWIIQFRRLIHKLYPKLNVYNCRLSLSLETASSETLFISCSSMQSVVSRAVDEAELFVILHGRFFDYSTERTTERSDQVPRAMEIKGSSLLGNVTLLLSGKGRRRDCHSPSIWHMGTLTLRELRGWVWTLGGLTN